VEELQYGVVGLQGLLPHEVREIVAGGEAVGLSLQQQGMHVLVPGRLAQRVGKGLIHPGVEGIALVRPVEGQDEQAILLFGQNCEGHV